MMFDDLIIALLDPICTPFMWLLRLEYAIVFSLLGIVVRIIYIYWKGDMDEDFTASN